jgi:transposase
MSRRQAASRFGVSTSSAIRWTSLSRRTGDVRPKRQGGDKRSARIEACAPVILGAVEDKPDTTLVELQRLLSEHGVTVAVSTLWRFFARRKITLKKSPRMRRSRTVPTS